MSDAPSFPVQVVTVARYGSKMTGGDHPKPIYATTVYEARPRQSDGAWTYRRLYAIDDATSGNGISGAMVERARAYAEAKGLPYLPHVRHGSLACTLQPA